MATTTWTGNAGPTASDGDNWDNGLPGAGDDAIFPPDSAIANPPVGGLDLTGLNELAAPIRSITVSAGATYNVGTSQAPLKVPVGLLVHEGSGTVRLTHVATNPPVVSGRVIVKSSNRTDALIVGTDGENIAELVCLSGKTVASGNIDRMFVLPALEWRTVLEMTSGLGDVYNVGGELLLKTGATPGRVIMSNGSAVVEGYPAFMAISGGIVDWRSVFSVEVKSEVFLARGTLTSGNVVGAQFKSLAIGPNGHYDEGDGVVYGQLGLSYLAEGDPIGA